IGGGAWLAWILAAIVVIVLALAHAELGAMYPVSGGTGRFPHFAFGSVAGIGFGFFSYAQAVTIAPIECYAFVTYASYYWPILIGTVIYVLLQIAFIGALPAHEIPNGLQHITNPDIKAGPFAAVATLTGLAWLAHILRIDAFVSPSGTGLIYTTGTSRVSYGL